MGRRAQQNRVQGLAVHRMAAGHKIVDTRIHVESVRHDPD